MTRQFKTLSIAGVAALCAVLWPMPLYAQQAAGPARSTVSAQRGSAAASAQA